MCGKRLFHVKLRHIQSILSVSGDGGAYIGYNGYIMINNKGGFYG